MNLIIRKETPKDYRDVEALTREAFWGAMGNPTCSGEHLIVCRLRTSPDFVPELDLAAVADLRRISPDFFSCVHVFDVNAV